MMSNLHEMIPGAERWPHFVRNRSEQFEARFVMVEVQASPSLFFDGMAGSRMPVAVAHGEGYAEFADAAALAAAQPLVALRFVDNRGAPTEIYPLQSQRFAAGHHRTDHAGRPLHHPDAASRSACSAPCRIPGIRRRGARTAPWLRMFRNARRWVG